jgi:glycosyltransferase involved in cell wall biosynthesis
MINDGARVYLIVETYYPVIGGGETQSKALAEDLQGLGHPVTVVTRRSEPTFAARETLNGVAVHRLGPGGSGQAKKWAMLVPCFLHLLARRREYDVILVSGFRVLGIAAMLAALWLRKPCVLKADNTGEMSGAYFRHGVANLGVGRLRTLLSAMNRHRQNLLRRADVFVTLSTEIAAELRTCGVPAASVLAIPNGYDPARFHVPTPEERHALRIRFGLPAEAPVAVFTGRLLRGKGLPSLMRAWREIVRERPDAKLLVVGSGGDLLGSCEQEIRQYAATHDLLRSVVFTGSVREVEAYLRVADLFVFPTLDEAFGISLLEAMASGLPCVATNVGGIRDIIQDGETGHLIPPDDDCALRDSVLNVLTSQDLGRAMGLRAAQVAVEKYTRQRVASQYASLLNSLIRRKNAHGQTDQGHPLCR